MTTKWKMPVYSDRGSEMHKPCRGILISAAAGSLIALLASCGQKEPLARMTTLPPAPTATMPSTTSNAATKDGRETAEFRKFVPGKTKITLKPRKDKYFLGENILLDYKIRYEGDGALEVGKIAGLRTRCCYVTATDQAGNRAADSTLAFDEWGSGGRWMRKGYDSVVLTIPLMRYCRFEKPGIYRVRVAEDLGWSNGHDATGELPPIPDDDPRWTQTTIALAMPNAAQAGEVVENMRRLAADVKSLANAWWEAPNYADFLCLQYPVYLPILEDLAVRKDGDRRALTGIAHTPEPEATEALLRLMKHPDKDIVLLAAAALCDRLPDPQGITRNRRNPIEVEDADPKLVKRAWRGEFAPPACQCACKMLTEGDPRIMRCGAFILEAVGRPEDMPALVAAINQLVPLVEKAEPEKYIGQMAAVREECRDMVYAAEALASHGVEPQADPQTPGEVIHFVLAIKRRKDFRPAGWEKRCADWIHEGSPYVREAVLFNAPHPMPESLRESYRTGLYTVIAATSDWSVLHRVVQTALDLNLPTDEVLGMLAGRLDSKPLHVYIVPLMRQLLETGKCEHFGTECDFYPGDDRAAAEKAAWRQFLEENGKAIREGKRFRQWEDRETLQNLLR